MFFELLHAKPCRTIVKLPQEVSFGPEMCEIGRKVWFLASGFCLLRLGEPLAGTRGNPNGPQQVTAFKKLYKNPLEIPEGIPSYGIKHKQKASSKSVLFLWKHYLFPFWFKPTRSALNPNNPKSLSFDLTSPKLFLGIPGGRPSSQRLRRSGGERPRGGRAHSRAASELASKLNKAK